MPKHTPHALIYNAGCAVDADMYYLAARLCAGPNGDCANGFESPSYMLFYQHQTADKWFHHELLDWQVESTAFIPAGTDGSPRRVCALAEDGRLEDLSRAETRIEHVQSGGAAADLRGGLSRVRLIGDTLFCCGMAGGVYERTPAGWKQLPTDFPEHGSPPLVDEDYEEWRETLLQFFETNQLHASLPAGDIEREQFFSKQFQEAKQHQLGPEVPGPLGGIVLQDLTGTSARDLYVVGESGFIAHWNGANWQLIAPVTTGYLWHCRMTSSGKVMAVADEATILVGTVHEGFAVVPLTRPPHANFNCTCEWGDLVYIGSNSGIYTYRPGTNTVARLMDGVPRELRDSCIVNMDVAGGVLWVLAATALGRFDGTTWRLASPPTKAA